MTKIGIMSFAHMHAYSYATCLKMLPDVEFTAVWDDDWKRGQAAGSQFGTRSFEDLDKFLSLDMHGVIICSENVKHYPMAEHACEAGKAILCEKPLATTVKDAEMMVTLCKNAGVALGTAFPCRFSETLRQVRQRMQQGEIGELYAAACTNNGSYPGGWFADTALSGGGAVMDHTVHVADALRWITGKEIRKVYCASANVIRKGIGTDDVGSIHFEMDGGVIVSHVASWNRAETFPTWGDVTMEFIGSNGVLYVDAFNQKIDVYSDRAQKGEWAYWGDSADLELVRDFCDAIRDDRSPSASGVDGLRAVEVTAAAYQSARCGEMVSV